MRYLSFWIVAMVVVVAALVQSSGPIDAVGTWKDRDAMVSAVANDPGKFVDLVAADQGIGQAACNRLWNAMFPPPTPRQQRQALRDALQQLRAMDLPADDPVIVAIRAKLQALPAEEAAK